MTQFGGLAVPGPRRLRFNTCLLAGSHAIDQVNVDWNQKISKCSTFLQTPEKAAGRRHRELSVIGIKSPLMVLHKGVGGDSLSCTRLAESSRIDSDGEKRLM